MLKNYFKTSLRNVWKNKAFSAINVIGLSIGISAALVIFLIVQYDFSFDKFEKGGDRIYQVVAKNTYKVSGENNGSAATPDPMGKAVNDEVTGLEAVAAFRPAEPAKVSVPFNGGNKKLDFNNQKHIVFTAPGYFKLVGYNWIAGNAATALQQPYQVVLTESNAKLYFPALSATQVVGKELYFDDTVRTTVTGIVKDIASNTDFDYKTFISRITLETTSLQPRFWSRWDHSQSSMLFVKLAPSTTPANIKTQITSLFAKYNKPNDKDQVTRTFDLQPLSDYHFKGYYANKRNPNLADKSILYGLLAVAAFLLLLACINFINLTTAQATQRAKEIGIRKTMGSSKWQLVFQFMGETFFLTLIATTISVAFMPLLLKAFSSFIPAGVQFNLAQQPVVLLFLLSLTITVSLLAGFYPAIVLSSFKPVLVLKNQAYAGTNQSRSAWLRKGLTVSQFVIAQVFIIATMLVSKQINYTLNKDIGIKKDAIVYFGNYTDTSSAKKMVLLNKLKAMPGVAMAGLAMDPPASTSTWIDAMTYTDGKKQIKTDVQVKIADSNYIKLYQIKLLAGSNLVNNDSMGNLLINETYSRALGFSNPQDAVGRFIDVYGLKRVTGVVQDFHQKSLHEKIIPLLITGNIQNEYTFNIALRPQNADGTLWQATISQMQKAYKEVYPKSDFEYAFLDDTIAAYYTAEQNVSVLLLWSTGLTIFISCLGLLGLVMYITNQRRKEIGVRKVIGATVTQLVGLLSRDFLKLIAIAFVIAVPFAWWGANTWLQSFAYKTTLSWWVFVSGGAVMLVLAFIVLSIRTFKAASANPVKSLRTE